LIFDSDIPIKSAVTEGIGLNVFAKIATAARIATIKNSKSHAIGYVFSSGFLLD
jgi:hypothetical protein